MSTRAPPVTLVYSPYFLATWPTAIRPVGRDFAAGHAWHHGIGAVLLDVAQVVVVAVLQAGQFFLEHKLVPARREHAGRHGLADVAAHAFAVAREQVFKSLDLAHAHQVVDLLARVREVLAEVVVHRQAPGVPSRPS